MGDPDSKNHTARLGINCTKEFNEILEERLKTGIDKKKKSIRIISDLIITHEMWPVIKAEAIEHKFNGEKQNGK